MPVSEYLPPVIYPNRFSHINCRQFTTYADNLALRHTAIAYQHNQ